MAVAEKRGFASAARHLDMSTSSVSRLIVGLERSLGVQLFHRTTRSITLTDTGSEYLARCSKIVDEIDALDETALKKTSAPAGQINLTASVFLGKAILTPLIGQFLAMYPDIKVNLLLVDRSVDLIAEAMDVAVRVGRLRDASYVARKIHTYEMVLVASPAYLKKHGTPHSIKDLDSHNCLVDRVPRFGDRWPLSGSQGRVAKRVSGNFMANDGETVRDLARNDVGITYLPDFFVREDLDNNRLVPVLQEFVTRTGEISVVFPPTRYEATRVRVLIDFLVEKWPR